MAGRRVYNSGGGGSDNNNTINNNSNISALLQSSSFPCGVVPDQPLDSFFLSESSSFFGSRSMVSFEDVRGGNKREESFSRSFDHDEAGDEEFQEYFHQPEKKRRLSAEQVHFLEKSFELENKLEPERKIQLAKDIGLQPRQVAIWFQNRRARWKSKQLEKDFDALQASYDRLKTDYGSLLDEKDKLEAEVLDLTEKLRLRGKGDSQLSDTNKLSKEPPQKLIVDPAKSEVSKNSTVVYKQVEINQAKGEMFDSESYTCGVHSSLLDPGHSSYAFEPDQSDISQDEDDTLNKSLMLAYIFPKIEDADFSIPPTDSCNFGFPVEDQPFWSWSL